MKKAVKISNHELTSNPGVTVRRTLVFNYIAAVCLQAAEAQVGALLRLILTPLQREISNHKGNPELRAHSTEVMELVKSRADDATFHRVLVDTQLDLNRKRAERSEARKQNLLLNPQAAAKRKISQNEAKKNAKKARRLKKKF